MIEGNVRLTVENLQSVEGVNQLNRMIQKLFTVAEEDPILYSMILDTEGEIVSVS